MNYFNIYKKSYLYGVLPFATVNSIAATYMDRPIYKHMDDTAPYRLSEGIQTFGNTLLLGVIWPLTLPLTVVALAKK